MGQAWTQPELELFEQYFKCKWRTTTLAERIHRVNPRRPYESITRRVRRMRGKGFVRNHEQTAAKLRIGYFDIETTNLDADFGMMLCWCIKPRGRKDIDFGMVTKEELFNLEWDKRITAELLATFNKYDILYTHWGADRRFDLPFIRTRAYKHNLQDGLPDKDEKFIRDTWPIARCKLKLSRNSLERIASALNIGSVKKTFLDPDKLMRARYGSETDLDWILLHCKRDVQLLERVHRKLEKVENPNLRSM